MIGWAICERLAQHEAQRRGQLRLADPALDELDVPVAQLAVDEVVERERGVREVVGVDPLAELALEAGQAREDPAVLDRRRQRRGGAVLLADR
jgi:NAD(P)-dependent dehydrogenase (short-subunit alcohol dehydrogenase family)